MKAVGHSPQTGLKPVSYTHLGITGSGKTEVYIKIIEKVLSEGKQAIVLVPEISLTPLMTGRFINRFGSLAAVTHSKMNCRERFNCWKRAKDGDISVVIGPRSALFRCV